MKMPIYISSRVCGERVVPQVIFNDPNGKRAAIFSVNALYKKVYADDFRKLSRIPNDDYWSHERVMNLAVKALETGVVTIKEKGMLDLSFEEYASKIWTFDDSPRVARLNREKAASIHRSHCDDILGALKMHVFPNLPADLKLHNFSFFHAEKIKDVMLKNGCSNSTINKVMSGIRVVLEEAFRTGLIEKDESLRVRNVKSDSESYGILSKEETGKLLSYLDGKYPPNTYERFRYLVVAFAVQSCARMGEILAIRPSRLRIAETYYSCEISRSWSDKEGEKTTKNGESRSVAISIELGQELLEYATLNPKNCDDGYIFFSKDNARFPLDKDCVRESFYDDLEACLGISEEERHVRNLVFHSLRHTAVVQLHQVTSARELKLATGHKSDAVFQIYAGHQTQEDLETLAAGMNSVRYIPNHMKEETQ